MAVGNCHKECKGVDIDELFIAPGSLRYIFYKLRTIAVLRQNPNSSFLFVNIGTGEAARVPALCAVCLLEQALKR